MSDRKWEENVVVWVEGKRVVMVSGIWLWTCNPCKGHFFEPGRIAKHFWQAVIFKPLPKVLASSTINVVSPLRV
jgi:hypothetical protein